jgi:phospholipid/cholesterol/gamma-HCH transport system substrate-binding protein
LEAKTNYTIVGLAVLFLASSLLAAALWLSIGFDQKKYCLYTVYVHEPISGLSEDSVVKFNGVKVGFVNKIELSQLDPQAVKILLKIEENTPITTSTRATLITQGITGTTYLGLSATSSTFVPLQKTPGEPYPVIPYQASFFNLLEKNMTDISVGLKRVLSKKNAENLKKSLSNLQKITDIFADNNENLQKSLRDLPKLIAEFKVSAHEFGSMANDVAKAGRQVSSTMQAGRNSIDKISQQAIPPTVLLLRRLELIAANLEKTSAEMRQNPAVIIRGSAPPKPGPGER